MPRKTLAIVTKNRYGEGIEEQKLEQILTRKNIGVGYFHWRALETNGTIRQVTLAGHEIQRHPLDTFDGVYINSLGAIGEGNSEQFLEFIETLRKSTSYVMNDPQVMKANLDKGYLLDLQRAGIETIPTRQLNGETYQDLRRQGTDIVLKPRIFGERMKGVQRISEMTQEEYDAYLERHNQGGILWQPYLEEVLQGERSFIYVGKELSHGVRRNRTAWNANSTNEITLTNPTEEERNLCERVLEAAQGPLHITRLDIIGNKEEPKISEVERINPNTWYGRRISGVDKQFGKLLTNHIAKKL